jgi:hypothetical protein
MSRLLISAFCLFSIPAFACFDPDAQTLDNEQILTYASNTGFAKCLEKLEQEGVNLGTVAGARKDRAEDDESAVAYTIMVQGQDAQDLPVRIYIEWNIATNRFVCGKPTRKIYRGCF